MKKIFTLFAALAMVMSMSAKPYLRGSFNGWGTGNEFQNGECTINLAANTPYEFKVDNNGDWSTSYGGAAITSTKCTDVSCSGSNNATIQTTLKGSYTFKWNASTKKISVVYPTEEVIKPKKDITVKAKMPASWTNTIDAWVWTDEDPNGKAVTPEKDGDWYVITQNTAASYIIFRNGAAWNGDANQTVDMCFEDNACIQLAQSGSSKATYSNIDCVSEFTLTATANPAEGGSVTGAGVYEEGTTVTLTATPNEGYEFVSWTNGGAEVSTNATYSFVIKANLALVANFKAVEATVYTISTEAVNGTVTGAGVYEEGATVTLTATPAEGYNFKNWTVSGAEVSAENPYIFTATADVTVTANFEEIPVVYETVYFVNVADWTGTINIHAWGGTAPGTEWPGNPADKEDYQIGGHDVYSLTADAGAYANVIFNNGGTQTSDLVWTAGKYYVVDEWLTKEEAEEKLASGDPLGLTYNVTVPAGTYACYIAGEMNGWSQQEMTKVDDTHYTITIVGATENQQYKYCSGPSWDYAENIDGGGNRTAHSENDVVTGWAKVYNPNPTVDPEPDPTYDYYITGTLAGGWDPKQQGLEKDGELYKATFTELDAGEYEFKITAGDWEHQWNYSNLGAAYEEVSQGVDNEGNPNGNIKIVTEEAKNITVIFDAIAGKITLEGLTEKVVPTYDYYITGTLAGGWDPKQQGLEKDGELYKATFTELNAGTYEFKITAGDWEHQWNYSNLGAAYEEVSQGVDNEGNPNGNIKIVTEEAKNITVIFDAIAGKITLEGLTEKVVVTPDVITYVLMGVGGDWTTGIALTKNETAEYGEEYVLLGQEIAEGDAVKVVTLTDGVATAWCGKVDEYSVAREFDENGNIVLAPGKYDFYFKVNDPATADDDIIYIAGADEPEVPTAIDNVDTAVAPAKAIVNGQLVIVKDGVKYNAQGAVVK